MMPPNRPGLTRLSERPKIRLCQLEVHALARVTMFSRLVHFLTAATFAAHGLWGCCWRDAHGCMPFPMAGHASSQSGDFCVHDHHDSGEPGNPHDAPCNLHCRGVCVFVSPVKSHVEALQIDIRLDFAADVSLLAEECLIAAADVRSDAGGSHGVRLRARLHVLHQLFLI